MALYDVVNGVYRKVTKKYDPVDGVYRNVKAAYDPVDGVYRQYYSDTKIIPVSELSVGDSVWMNVDGVPTEFLVIHQGLPSSSVSSYDASCDGTWFLAKDVLKTGTQSGNDLYDRVDNNVKAAMKYVKVKASICKKDPFGKYYYISTLDAYSFFLSGREVGLDIGGVLNGTVVLYDGALLDYFASGTGADANNKRIAYYNGTATDWWLRTGPEYSDTPRYIVTQTGTSNYSSATSGIRPAFILDGNTQILQSGGINTIA